MAATPAIMTLLADAPPVNTVADVVAAAVLEAEAVAVEVVVTTAVLEATELAADEDDAVAVGVVKVEIIPFPLTGYHQLDSKRDYLQKNVGARRLSGSRGETVHLVGTCSCILTSIGSVSRKTDGCLFTSTGTPRTGDVIACDGSRR
jgi:hypothetical protein